MSDDPELAAWREARRSAEGGDVTTAPPPYLHNVVCGLTLGRLGEGQVAMWSQPQGCEHFYVRAEGLAPTLKFDGVFFDNSYPASGVQMPCDLVDWL